MVKVDQEKCIGCGACVSTCPEVFEMKNMKAEVKKGKEKVNSPCIKEAIEVCPVEAITK